jgi:hypothetical protein
MELSPRSSLADLCFCVKTALRPDPPTIARPRPDPQLKLCSPPSDNTGIDNDPQAWKIATLASAAGHIHSDAQGVPIVWTPEL